MTTAAELINLCLTDSGVLGTGQTPQAGDTANALRRLNMMMAQWSKRRWLVYVLVDTSFPCTSQVSYTVGPGGNFNIARPDRIEAAYIRQLVPTNPTPIDWPLQIIESREEYSQIALKTLSAAPSEYIWYESSYPLGRVYPWPVPTSQYEVHILTKAVLGGFASVATTVLLPDEYEQAIYANFVNWLRAAYRLPADPFFIGMGKATLNTIRRSNFQIGRLNLPSPITPGPTYNVYSDQGG